MGKQKVHTTPEKAIEQGRRVWNKGLTADSCPYPKNSDLWKAWWEGFVGERRKVLGGK